MVALGAPFWGEVISGADPAGGILIVAYHGLSVICALICLAKAKWITGVVGFLLWPVALGGALRLARPGSLWARRLYSPQKLALARTRYPQEEAARPSRGEPVGTPR
jgi:type IV secretory pathway TrbD component